MSGGDQEKDEEEHSLTAGAGVTLLSFASGTTDVLSYLTLGHIFTSAMTGAAALCVLSLVSGDYPRAIRAAVALGSYLAGGALATALQPHEQGKVREPRVLRRLLVAEAVMLGFYCIVSAFSPHPPEGAQRYVLIFLSALAMGTQALAARDIGEPGISTVVFNLSLTSISVAVTRLFLRRGVERLPLRNKVQIIAVLAYGGAAAAAAASRLSRAFDIDFLPLIAVLCVLAAYHREARREQG